MQVYHDFFLVPGSRSTFPEADRIRANDTDPTGSGSGWIRNTENYIHNIFQEPYYLGNSIIFPK